MRLAAPRHVHHRALPLNWDDVFGFSVSPWELMLRGTLMYWFLFVLFRVVVRRHVDGIVLSDILLIVIVADAAQNAMSGEYKTFPEGAVLVATLVVWNVIIDWATFRFEALERLLEPPALLLVRHGHILRRNMRKELISEEELMSKLREHGVSNVLDVRAAFIESNGSITVLKRERG
jgi:uncharacterized membrane protein YcaP (DUF421 family)